MSSKTNLFLAKHLGEDFLSSLAKTELWKPATKSVTDIDDMRIGLKIVPRTVIALLVRELVPMNIGETKEVELTGLHTNASSIDSPAMMRVTKYERDVFSGDIEENNKKITEFKFRSIPGVGLVIMSAFELYETKDLNDSLPPDEMQGLRIQRMIDERMALHDLVGKVVDKKIMEREAIHSLVLSKLTEAIKMVDQKPVSAPTESTEMPISEKFIVKKEQSKKKRPLEEFLEKTKKPKEFSVQLAKGESVSCPDCGKNIFSSLGFSACICYGDSGKVFLKKTENGFKIRFSKNWDFENIEMLLEVLRKKNKK